MSVGNAALRVYTSAISLPRLTVLASIDRCHSDDPGFNE
jgi:hypothetical protein